MNKIIGVVDEVSKKAKSWKASIGKKNYYCTNDITHLVGRTIEFEYKDSDPYDFNGKQVTSKFILFDTIKIQAVDLPESTIKTQNKPISVPNSPIVDNSAKIVYTPDWERKARIEHRVKLWNTAVMTFAPELMKQEWREFQICDLCKKIVDYATAVIYEEKMEVPF